VALGATRAAQAENWPGWRGPARTGISSETDIPLKWSAAEGVLWKAPLPGSGISNPIVWEDKVFVTSSDGPKQSELHLICLDRDTGRELWHVRLWGTAPTLYHATKSSMASPTPVTDGRHVYAFFGTGDVFCVDLAGRLVWQRALADEYGEFENRFAASSSPLLYQDVVLLQCDHYGQSYVLALDQATGANRWKADRPEAWLSWATPQLVPVEGRAAQEFIVCGSEKIDAYDPLTGEKLWTVRGMRRECIPTPVFGHGLLYVVSGPKGPTLAIKPGGRGDVTDTHVVWSNVRGAPFVPSAILVGGLYYLVDDRGIATCLNAHSGKLVWQKRLQGEFTASPVAAGGHVYFVNETGQTVVIRAGVPAYEEVAQNGLDEPVFASPAISQGKLFLRSARHLYCIGRK
jgi:outer membrane protein assembly factor BamB